MVDRETKYTPKLRDCLLFWQKSSLHATLHFKNHNKQSTAKSPRIFWSVQFRKQTYARLVLQCSHNLHSWKKRKFYGCSNILGIPDLRREFSKLNCSLGIATFLGHEIHETKWINFDFEFLFIVIRVHISSTRTKAATVPLETNAETQNEEVQTRLISMSNHFCGLPWNAK